MPTKVEEIINKALEKDRDIRCQSAAEMRADLKRLKREIDSGRSSSVSYSSVAIAPAVGPSVKRSRGKIAAISTAGLIAALGLAYLLRPTLPPPRITGSTQITHDGQAKRFSGQVSATVLTDGPRIFVQENISGRFVVVQGLSTGGDTVTVPTNFANVSLINISGDKSELLVGSFTGAEDEQVLWGLPVIGGTPRRLSDTRAADGTWMPNGDVLISHENQLWVVPKEGGTARKFANPGDFSFWLRWSPDGKVLRFTRNEAGVFGNDLWQVSADGSGLQRVLPGWREGEPRAIGNWTPDGKYFVFIKPGGGRADIWAVREKGDWFHKVDRQPVQLTTGPLAMEAPQPSLDGKKIFAIGVQARTELSRYDAKAGQFVPFLNGESVQDVSFSRDGQWVAYVTLPEGQLWRSRIDGNEKLQLASTQTYTASTAWSPEGQQVAYILGRPGQPDQLCLVGKDGGSPQVVYQGEGLLRPSWRRDGSAIVFAQLPGLSENALVKVLDLKTGKANDLPDSKGLIYPAVSPDGRYMASGTADGKKLRIYDFNSQSWQEFTPQTGVGSPEWSADGRYLYFDNGLSPEPAIYRFRMADHKVEQLASLKNFRRTVFSGLPWFGLTPKDDPLVMRDVGTQEVYALDFEEP